MSHLRKYWRESKGVVLTLAMMGAILPVVIWGVVNKQQLAILASAKPMDEMRLWLEPPEVVMTVGQKTKFTIMAEYSRTDKLIPMIKTNIQSDEGLKTNTSEIIYNWGFSGKTKIGEVEVEAVSRGARNLAILDNSVFTGLPDLSIVTAGAKIWVK
jgi:hypothetical protein